MRKIFFIVLAVHIVAIIWMALAPTIKKETKKPLYVKTVMPKSPSQVKIEQHAPSIKAAAPSKPVAPTPEKIAPLPKKEEKIVKVQKEVEKSAVAEQPAKKPSAPSPVKKNLPVQKPKTATVQAKTTPKKTESSSSAIPAHLLKELEESIAKIEQKQDKKLSKAAVQTPKWTHSLNVDHPEWEVSSSSSESGDYEQQLIQSLHETLHLPEYGMVKMRLTLRRDGTLIRVAVIETESQKNKSYLEKQISNVKFPHFSGSFFAKQQEYTFILTFCNEL